MPSSTFKQLEIKRKFRKFILELLFFAFTIKSTKVGNQLTSKKERKSAP